jgi:hypothetical protein
MRPFWYSMISTLLLSSWATAQTEVAVPNPAQQNTESQSVSPPHKSFKERLRDWFHRNDPAQSGATRADERYPPTPNGIAGHSALPGLPPVNLSGKGGR